MTKEELEEIFSRCCAINCYYQCELRYYKHRFGFACSPVFTDRILAAINSIDPVEQAIKAVQEAENAPE